MLKLILLARSKRIWVPHPRRVFVFAARVGAFRLGRYAIFFRLRGLRKSTGIAGAHGPQHARGVMAATHGHFAAAADFKNAALVFTKHLDQSFDLAFDSRHLDHQRLRGEVDDAGAEDFNQVEDLGAVARRCGDLDERQLSSHRRILGDIVHIDNVFKFIQTGANAIAGFRRCLADQREPREPGPFAAPHCERVYVDVQTAEERSHARKHARQVFNIRDECVQHKCLSSGQWSIPIPLTC